MLLTGNPAGALYIASGGLSFGKGSGFQIASQMLGFAAAGSTLFGGGSTGAIGVGYGPGSDESPQGDWGILLAANALAAAATSKSGPRPGDYPRRAYQQGSNTVIQYASGLEEVRSGGTWTWRNNNPGNLVSDWDEIGRSGGFAVFENLEKGSERMMDLINRRAQQGLTIDQLISSWAPPPQNPTSTYQQFVTKLVGVSGQTRLSDLTPGQLEQLGYGIRRFEGWKVGTITYR